MRCLKKHAMWKASYLSQRIAGGEAKISYHDMLTSDSSLSPSLLAMNEFTQNILNESHAACLVTILVCGVRIKWSTER